MAPKQPAMKKLFLSLPLWLGLAAVYAQNITRVEYFIDTDPGFGAATAVPGYVPGSSLSFQVPCSTLDALSEGLHRLFTRAQDENGAWSVVHSSLFYKDNSLSASPAAITRIEYFIDSDPGFGAATAVPGYVPGSPLSFQVPGAILDALAGGLHHLFIRAQDENGAWSVVHSSLFYKDNSLSASPAAITRIEYFIDSDPGFGAGTAVPGYVPGSLLAFQVPGATLDALAEGLHRLFIRAQDANGSWSVVHSSLFYKDYLLAAALPDIVKVEYFVDTDPGFGAGTDVPFTLNGNVYEVAFNPDMDGLDAGPHKLFVRALDARGGWSIVSIEDFDATPLPVRLVDFTAKKQETGVLLTWQTTEEVYASHFDIERSPDTKTWEKIGTVQAKGDSKGRESYAFTDQLSDVTTSPHQLIITSPIPIAIGTNHHIYYRLKQLDRGGSYEYSRLVSVTWEGEGREATVYPNPSADGHVQVQGVEVLAYELLDAAGRLLETVRFTQPQRALQLGPTTSGVYWLRLELADGMVVRRKVVMMRAPR